MGIVEFIVHLPIKITPKSDWVVAACPILDVVSQGRDVSEARKNITEALSLFFVSCFERGVLDDALKECGFVPAVASQMINSNESPSEDSEYIDVPIPLLLDDSKGKINHCRV